MRVQLCSSEKAVVGKWLFNNLGGIHNSQIKDGLTEIVFKMRGHFSHESLQAVNASVKCLSTVIGNADETLTFEKYM